MAGTKGNKNHKLHGMSRTRIYNIWSTMKQRCTNPHHCKYKNYGGRGVSIADDWNSFSAFYEWAIQNGYDENLTLDRICSDGDYEPHNCRWVNQREQQNNRTNNRRIEIDGESHTLSEWSEISGIHLSTIWGRLKKGWSEKDAVFTYAVVGRNQYI